MLSLLLTSVAVATQCQAYQQEINGVFLAYCEGEVVLGWQDEPTVRYLQAPLDTTGVRWEVQQVLDTTPLTGAASRGVVIRRVEGDVEDMQLWVVVADEYWLTRRAAVPLLRGQPAQQGGACPDGTPPRPISDALVFAVEGKALSVSRGRDETPRGMCADGPWVDQDALLGRWRLGAGGLEKAPAP